MVLPDDILQMFQSESQKLLTLIDSMSVYRDTSISDIVDTYYKVVNVSSMAAALGGQHDDSKPSELLAKIQEVQSAISEKFNCDIHPKILAKLSLSVEELTLKLQSNDPGNKSKEEIELDAKLFEELRQTMSTREFVKQYDDGIAND